LNLGEEKRRTMKRNKLITTLLALVCASVAAKAEEKGSWKQWTFSVSPVYTVAVSDFKFSDVRQGGGLQGELFVVDNLSVSLLGTTYSVKDSVVDEAAVSLNYYIPLGNTFYTVASLGSQKGFELNENWHYKGGLGFGARITDKVSAQVGGYLVDDFQDKTELRFQGGLGVSF